MHFGSFICILMCWFSNFFYAISQNMNKNMWMETHNNWCDTGLLVLEDSCFKVLLETFWSLKSFIINARRKKAKNTFFKTPPLKFHWRKRVIRVWKDAIWLSIRVSLDQHKLDFINKEHYQSPSVLTRVQIWKWKRCWFTEKKTDWRLQRWKSNRMVENKKIRRNESSRMMSRHQSEHRKWQI